MAFSLNNTTSNITLNTTTPYLVVDDEGLKAFAVNVGPPGAVGPAGADGSDAEATTDAGDLTTGTLPLGRLSGITTSQLSATAGILGSQLSATAGIASGQITSLDANKLTGRVAAALINGGTSSQFLRGDGTFSNTLAGALNLGGDLIGTAAAATGTFLRSDSTSGADNKAVGIHAANSFATNRTGYVLVRGINSASNGGGVEIRPCTAGGQLRLMKADATSMITIDTAMTLGAFTGSTATFSGAVATGALTVTGAMAASGAVSGTTGTFSGNLILSATNGLILRPANTGYNALCGGSTESQASGSYIRCYGASDGSYPGQIWIVPNTGTGLYDGAFGRQAYVYSAGILLGAACKIIYANAGTTTAANNEIVGAVGGLRYNVASGLAHTLLVANAAVFSAVASSVTSVVDFNVIKASGNASFTMRPASPSTSNFISFQSNAGAGEGFFQENLGTMFYSFNTQTFRSFAGTVFMSLSATSLAMSVPITLASGAPATATSAGTAGQIAWDSSGNIYICSATNTWRRVATNTF